MKKTKKEGVYVSMWLNTKSGKKKNRCSICGEEYLGFGNNARPVNSKRCCDDCNTTVVIPSRIKELVKRSAE